LRSGAPLLRKAQSLRRAAAISAFASAVSASIAAGPALAEFQIQEAGIEQGEVEIEYRGAYHWGVPRPSEANENANDLIQSHDIELQMGITDWWLIQVTGGFDQPIGESFQASSVEIESEFGLIKRHGDGIAVSFQLGYEQASNRDLESGDPNQFGFGPIVELAKGPLLVILNPLFTRQIGTFADQEGLGFEYGWRAGYALGKKWAVGVEMFGEIEDLANAATFDQQVHSIGPTLFYSLSGDADSPDDAAEEAGPAQMALSLNVGLQFGLTAATSDAALKFQGSLAF
jgi:hypothetical protein